jgi:hypothetical protein
MTAITLYELAAEFRATADQLADLDLPPEVVADTLESISLPLEQKAVQVAAFARNLEATAEQIKAAEKQMADRRKSMESRAKWLRDYLMRNMQACGIEKIEHPLFRLAVRENPPAAVIDSEQQIPLDYIRQPEAPPPVLDKALIRKALMDGFDVPGAHLERGMRLEIK